MITRSNLLFSALAISIAISVQGQSNKSIDQTTRPRTVASANTTAAKPEQQAAQRTTSSRAPQANDKKAANHSQQDEARAVAREESSRRLSPNRLRIRISEAQRLM